MPLLPDLAPRIEAAPAIDEVEDAYDFLRQVYRSRVMPLPVRMRAAIEALPFERPKLTAMAMIVDGGDFASRLDQAIARSGKVLEHMPAPIAKAKPEAPAEEQSPARLPAVPDRQFRRA